MKFYKWYKIPIEGTRVEVTKDYFSDNDPYINPENGWVKLENLYIEVNNND